MAGGRGRTSMKLSRSSNLLMMIVVAVAAAAADLASGSHGPPHQEIMGQVNQVAHMNFLAGTNSPFSINQTKHIHPHIMHL